MNHLSHASSCEMYSYYIVILANREIWLGTHVKATFATTSFHNF